jgi:hypothetical protein
MGTRGALAFGDADEWRGVYNHSDSTPPLLGPKVWRLISEARARKDGLAELRARLVASGRVEALVDGVVADEPAELSDATAHPLHISYVYVVDPERATLHVLKGDPRAEVIPIDPRALSEPEDWRYVCLASYPLAGSEPDWRTCGAAWRAANCERHVRPIRERFGEAAAAAARRQWLEE